MVFSSLPFLCIFLPLVLVCYFSLGRRWQNHVLLAFSLFFYAWGEPVYVLLMLFSITANFYFGLWLDKARTKSKAKLILFLSVVVNIGLLAYFKYAGFIIDTLNSLFSLNISEVDIPLPIGISFYTFQAMSYVIDLYRKEVEVQTSWLDLGTYISMFPQLIAGPIVRIQTIAEELKERSHSVQNISAGGQRFVIGLAKKVILANQAGELWAIAKNYPSDQLSPLLAWWGLLAFTFQIYFDFSAYSDMAIGLGQIFGFHFLENFRYPYMARSITDFWRRWHISLSSWFKEYVYIPLGGNRKGQRRQIINICIVWLLTGLWHGASWNFVLWGGYFAILLIFEKRTMLNRLAHKGLFLQHAYTMLAIMFGWLIFAFDELDPLFSYLKALLFLNGAKVFSGPALYYFLSFGFLMASMAIGSTPIPKNLWKIFRSLCRRGGAVSYTAFLLLRWALGLAIAFYAVAYLVDAGFNPFLYFRF